MWLRVGGPQGTAEGEAETGRSTRHGLSTRVSDGLEQVSMACGAP